MEHEAAVRCSAQAEDFASADWRLRVALRCHDDADSRSLFPGERGYLQFSPGTGDEDRKEIGVEQRQDSLGFRIAEAAVELEDFGAVPGEHEASVEDADEGAAFGGEAVDDRLDQEPRILGGERGRADGGRSVGAHAARVGAEVPVEEPLVVLGARHRHDVRAIAEDHQ